MNAISPYALADIRKSAQALGGAVREAGNLAAIHATKSAGPGGAPAHLGKLSSTDFAQVASRIATRATVGEGFGIGAAKAAFDQVADIRANLKAARSGDPVLQPTSDAMRGTLTDAVRSVADETRALAAIAAERAMQAHHRLANAPPALPGDPAARAHENLPAPDLVRATYATLIRLT